MRPKTLNDIVGQTKAVEVLKTLIKSSKKNNEAIPHVLISASSGCGKTSIAQALANDIGSSFFSVNCSTIGKSSNLFDIINETQENSVLFLDEIHALTKKTCESLYNILEDFCYYEDGYKVDIPKITVIGASTEIGRLPIPLKGRFKFTASLEPYTEDELVYVCKMVCEEKGFKLNESLAKIIAKTCRGIPRNMVSRAEWIYAYMSGNNLKSINKDKILDIIALQGVNKDGLEDHDIEYLNLLNNHRKGLSLSAISSKLLIDKENILNIIEPYLMKSGFVEIAGPKGRILTRDGRNYIENL